MSRERSIYGSAHRAVEIECMNLMHEPYGGPALSTRLRALCEEIRAVDEGREQMTIGLVRRVGIALNITADVLVDITAGWDPND